MNIKITNKKDKVIFGHDLSWKVSKVIYKILFWSCIYRAQNIVQGDGSQDRMDKVRSWKSKGCLHLLTLHTLVNSGYSSTLAWCPKRITVTTINCKNDGLTGIHPRLSHTEKVQSADTKVILKDKSFVGQCLAFARLNLIGVGVLAVEGTWPRDCRFHRFTLCWQGQGENGWWDWNMLPGPTDRTMR